MEPKRIGKKSSLVRKAMGWAGAGAVGFVAFLTLMSPMAAAASVSFAPPYLQGHTIQSAVSNMLGPGASVKVLVPAVFIASSGLVQEKVAVSAAAMGSQPAFATYASVLGVGGLAFTPTLSGPHLLKVGWTISYQAKLVVNARIGTPVAAMLAAVQIREITTITEKTTGLVIPGGTFTVTLVQNTITAGQFAASLSMSNLVGGPMPLNLLAGHTYVIKTTLSANVFAAASIAAPPGSTATASVDFGTPSTFLGLVTVL